MIFVISALGLIFPDPAQAAPPSTVAPFVHYQAPRTAVISSDYECGSESIRLTIEVETTSVRVTDYRAGERLATPEEISTWNERLSELREFSHFRFGCHTGGHQAVSIYGKRDPLTPQLYVVSARWTPYGIDLQNAQEVR